MSEGIAVRDRDEVREDAGEAEAAAAGVAVCRHHWIIASPNGSPMSRGVCNRCGAVREFPTALADTVWDSEVYGAGRHGSQGGGFRRGQRGSYRDQN